MKVWRGSICISPPGASSTEKGARQAPARHPGKVNGPSHRPATGKYSQASEGPQTAHRAGSSYLQDEEGDRRASLRTDQGATRISTLQSARPDQCPGRMETRVRYRQLTEAFPLWSDSGSRLKGENK